jgi:hypothetical protein
MDTLAAAIVGLKSTFHVPMLQGARLRALVTARAG